MKISKLIELLTPYAEMDAVIQQWRYNEQRDYFLPVTGVLFLITDEGAESVSIVVQETEE